MSIGVIAGFALAYPANVWLVARGLKHGLMTERAKTEASAPSEPHQQVMTGAHDNDMPSHEQHSSHAAESQAAKPEHADHASHGANKASGHHGGHKMSSDATISQVAALGAVSLLALAFGVVAPANWLNMTLSA